MKKLNTNHISYIIIGLVLIGMVLVFLELATLTEVSTFGSMLAVLVAALGFRLTADAEKPAQKERVFTPNPDLDVEAEELERLKK